MLCKDLVRGMVLFVPGPNLRAWTVPSLDIGYPRLRVGTTETANVEGVRDFLNDDQKLLYVGTEQVVRMDGSKRHVRLFHLGGTVCYVECFDVHNLEVAFA
jgi:hypothetical protein